MKFCHSDIKEVYHNLFDEALERYNAKQKQSDRKIDDYYEKIRWGKQEKLFYEVIFQIGNKDDMNVQSNEGQLAKDILCEFMEQFQKRIIHYLNNFCCYSPLPNTSFGKSKAYVIKTSTAYQRFVEKSI